MFTRGYISWSHGSGEETQGEDFLQDLAIALAPDIQSVRRIEAARTSFRGISWGVEDIKMLGKSDGDGSKPWYLVNPKIAGKRMFIPLKMYL